MTLPSAHDIVSFWREAGPEKWFAKDEAFDAEIARRFLPAHEAAAAGKLAEWEEFPEGVYALVILLDQFPRNMFRGSPRAFATDKLAVEVAERDRSAPGLGRQVPPVVQDAQAHRSGLALRRRGGTTTAQPRATTWSPTVQTVARVVFRCSPSSTTSTRTLSSDGMRTGCSNSSVWDR